MIHLLDIDGEYEMKERDNGTVYGPNYRDYMLMRVDGECWEGDDACKVIPLINKNDDFNGWDSWKEFNHEGYDCTVK